MYKYGVVGRSCELVLCQSHRHNVHSNTDVSVCVLCAVQCSSEASVSSDVNTNESTDNVFSRLSQLIADKSVDSDAIHVFIAVITDTHNLVVISMCKMPRDCHHELVNRPC